MHSGECVNLSNLNEKLIKSTHHSSLSMLSRISNQPSTQIRFLEQVPVIDVCV